MRSNNRIDKRKLAVRIVAWVLIIMTIATTLYTAIYFIIMGVNAADAEDISIAVGLLYGDDVDVALTAETTNGFTVGSETIEKYKKTFTELWSLPGVTRISALCDMNYAKIGDDYRLNSNPDVGAYRIDTGVKYSKASDLKAEMTKVDEALSGTDYYAIPAYVNGTYMLRISILSGSVKGFLTAAAAEAAITDVAKLLPDANLTVKAPTSTGTVAVEHNTTKALFEYDCKDSFLAVDAINNADGTEAYLTMYNKNLYDGVFVFRRYESSSVTGIEVLTVVPLEEYVMGVVPYEISNSWPLETQKAFAILARTFVVDQMGKHWNQYGFNVCATANCQVYKGVKSVNDNVREAVTSTKGKVVTYNGKLADMYYSSSTGNCTADVKYVWGSSIAWLSGVETPWEKYLDHSNAFWWSEVSPKELCEYLNSRGYTALKGEIASITITATAGAKSTYVCGVTIKDTSGNVVEISRCDKVKSAFSKYLNSANFVVGKGSVEYTKYTKTLPPPAFRGGAVEGSIFSVITGSGTGSFDFSGSVSVIAGSGTSGYSPNGSISVITSDGVSSSNVAASTDPDDYIITETMTAEDAGNFIFVGKGWGHGVGLSQWGLRDLADMGVDYLSMIQAYCPGVTLGDYKNFVTY